MSVTGKYKTHVTAHRRLRQRNVRLPLACLTSRAEIHDDAQGAVYQLALSQVLRNFWVKSAFAH
jgi:hypothetical protein